jgi:hypothetical protein
VSTNVKRNFDYRISRGRQPGKVGNLDSLLYFKYFMFLEVVNFQVLDPLKQVLGVSNEI